MELCIYCGKTMRFREESAKHPFECYGAKKAFDDTYQSDLTKAIKELTKVVKKLTNQRL